MRPVITQSPRMLHSKRYLSSSSLPKRTSGTLKYGLNGFMGKIMEITMFHLRRRSFIISCMLALPFTLLLSGMDIAIHTTVIHLWSSVRNRSLMHVPSFLGSYLILVLSLVVLDTPFAVDLSSEWTDCSTSGGVLLRCQISLHSRSCIHHTLQQSLGCLRVSNLIATCL